MQPQRNQSRRCLRLLVPIFAASVGMLLTLPVMAINEAEAEQSIEPDDALPELPELPAPTEMTLERLDQLLKMADENAERVDNTWQIHFGQVAMMIVVDERADRMRIMAPIVKAEVLNDALMLRVLQANFDSALDARYAVARGVVWSTFVHPLMSLSEMELISAIYQVMNAAESFGTTFSSGMFTYGGGDSENENRKLLEELHKRMRPSA